ncbi:MAG: sn-glycerol-1-phosphate dehydrogenase [Bacillota bacterium]
MNQLIHTINQRAQQCTCENHEKINMVCYVQEDAIRELPAFLQEKRCKNLMLVADENTWEAAGTIVSHLLDEAEISYSICIISPNSQGDVIADEQTIVEILLQVQNDTDMIAAVGSGTIHDLVRFVCSKVKSGFISIPTAASVDGFTSAGAPIIIKGEKKTIQTISPQAVFADLNILTKAPKKLTAAGFGDMVGKSTSLADWLFSRDIGNEPFCPLAYELTEQALKVCVDEVHEISNETTGGIKTLFESLLISGFAMLIVGHSRPASGAEHHLSHYWEMEFIKENRRQLLHGAKVAVATIIIARLYKDLKQLQEKPNTQAFDHIAEPDELIEILSKVGSPTKPSDLGIDDNLVAESLRNAHELRDRYTGLKWFNEQRILNA